MYVPFRSMTCCHLMGSAMTGSVHSVLLRPALCVLKSSAMTETGGNLMEQGQG